MVLRQSCEDYIQPIEQSGNWDGNERALFALKTHKALQQSELFWSLNGDEKTKRPTLRKAIQIASSDMVESSKNFKAAPIFSARDVTSTWRRFDSSNRHPATIL